MPVETSSMAKAFPSDPVDFGILGRDIWHAWNRLESAIGRMQCAQPYQMTDAAARLDEAKNEMLKAMTLRDRENAK